ncbi:T-complex protein 1, alpha subunit [Opisthorchis viverrini]|uniref:T-complex protein 1 subunit alpha n=1 Tax=Opisthorchis viverrini TaxID=6198 RepID=A0A1S8WGN8_OPIVI|nr:T-complex protein 1, alpha subunit [Opisthorchis viverrini]
MSSNATTALLLGGERTSGESVRKQNGELILSTRLGCSDGFKVLLTHENSSLSVLRSPHLVFVDKNGIYLNLSLHYARVEKRRPHLLAACSIANIVKSSLGPVGLDKMLVDDVGDVTITNDGATILKLLDVEHPAGKILVQLAQLQDEEVGDGTTSVVILAAALLKGADELISRFVHPTTIINGYRLACREACKYIQEHLKMDVTKLGKQGLVSAARTAMSSKLINLDAEMFADMVVEAVTAVGINGPKGLVYPVKSINVLKAHGRSMSESMFIKGYALNCTVASQQMPRSVKNAKIAFLDFSLQKVKMKLGVQVVVNDPDQLEAIRKRELDITKERIQKILAAGANVILTTGGIDDLCMKYFVEANAMAVRRCKKSDLKNMAKATGGQLIVSMSDMEGEEVFDAQKLGKASEVAQERICDDELIILRGPKVHPAASIILRGANDFYVDEMERSLHDAILVVKRVLESKDVVPGAGACEAAISIYLENFAVTLSSREQLAIAEFARAMLSIPKQLAVNAGLDSTELVARLRSCHSTSQSKKDQTHYKWWGLDLDNHRVMDCETLGVFEPMVSKIKSLKFATEAAITILRIDDLIKLNEEKEPPQHPDDY